MDFATGKQHDLIRDKARAFCDQEIRPYIREWDRTGVFPHQIVQKLGEQGFLGLCIPETEGGCGSDHLSLGLVCEELERADTAFRVFISVHLGLNSLALLQWGTDEQKQRYLHAQAKGEKIAPFALTEPEAGSDVAALQTRAHFKNGVYCINGEKSWIGFADIADHFLVFASTEPSLGKRGITAFFIERNTPGLQTASIDHKLGGRAGNTVRLFLQNVQVEEKNRLGAEGEGFKIAMTALDNGRFTVVAGAVGLIEACLDASISFSNKGYQAY